MANGSNYCVSNDFVQFVVDFGQYKLSNQPVPIWAD
jgi:hypothetical protein